MIISASYRTDIPAFYAAWFDQRRAAGFVRVKNPYGGPPATISLSNEDVDGFVFWTRNIRPFIPTLDRLASDAMPFLVQYTVTGYPRCLDAGTVEADQAIADIHALAARFGPKTTVWRYDPIVITSVTSPTWHVSNFSRLIEALAPSTDEVIVSVAQIYRKSARNLEKAAATHGFCWRDPPPDEKRRLLGELVAIAAGRGLRFSVCGQVDLTGPGIAEARCIDADRLAMVAGRPIRAAEKPHRSGCRCYTSRDIGAYDTCAHGCVYCYAVASRARAKHHLAAHDPFAEGLAMRSPEGTPTL